MPTYCIVLQPKSTTRNAQVADAWLAEGKPSPAAAGAILRRATLPELVGTWKDGKGITQQIIHLYAYKTGKAGTENKHELPPPHDNVLLFGEAVMFATVGVKFTSFSDVEYKKWYDNAFGGFEDLGDDDTESEGEVDEDAEEVEEEVEETAEDESESESEGEVVESEEEAEVVRKPVPKVAAKPKRNLKKLPAWVSADELMPEPYELG